MVSGRLSASEETWLRQFPTKKNSRIIHSNVFSIRKMVWIFCPQMTLSHFPTKKKINFFFTVMYLVLGKWCGFFVHKWRSLNSQKKFLWIFCPQMTLTQIPICGFFVHNFQIGVNITNIMWYLYIGYNLKLAIPCLNQKLVYHFWLHSPQQRLPISSPVSEGNGESNYPNLLLSYFCLLFVSVPY